MDINAGIAEKVMGWTVWFDDTAKCDAYVDSDVRYVGLVSDWHPSTDIAQAFQVIDKMHKETFSIRKRFKDELQRAVTKRVAPNLFAKNALIAHSDLIFRMLPIDICQAAKAAKETP